MTVGHVLCRSCWERVPEAVQREFYHQQARRKQRGIVSQDAAERAREALVAAAKAVRGG